MPEISSQQIVHITRKHTGTTDTIVRNDEDGAVVYNNASGVTTTIPTHASVPFDIGTKILLANYGTGVVTITGDTGVTVVGDLEIQPDRFVWVIKTNNSTWRVVSLGGAVSESVVTDAYEQAVYADVPVLLWKLNDTSLPTAIDSVDQSLFTNGRVVNDGTYYNSPLLEQTGFANSAASVLLNGVDQYIEEDSGAIEKFDTTFIQNEPITYEVVFKYIAGATFGLNPWDRNTEDRHQGVLFRIESSGRLLVRIGEGSGVARNDFFSTDSTYMATNFTDGDGIHVAVVARAYNDVDLYVNGVLVPLSHTRTDGSFMALDSNSCVRVGRAYGTYYGPMQVGCLVVFVGDLSPAQIAAHFAATGL